MTAVQKYLSRHAEPEARIAAKLTGNFGHVLIIPAYGEKESLAVTWRVPPVSPADDAAIEVLSDILGDKETSPLIRQLPR